MEIWKPLKGFESQYIISNYGNVKKLPYEQKLPCGKMVTMKGYDKKSFTGKDGYLYINLSKNGKSKHYSLHRLVAMTFIDNPNGYKEVNHKDENPLNPMADNLEWCDRKYNANYGTAIQRAKQKMSKRIERYTIDGKYLDTWTSEHEFTKKYGFNGESLIKQVCKHKKAHKTAYGYRWKYEGDNTPFESLNEKRRAVSQYNDLGEFICTYESVTKASKQTGIPRTTISDSLNGRRKKNNKYVWKYEEKI